MLSTNSHVLVVHGAFKPTIFVYKQKISGQRTVINANAFTATNVQL